MFLELLVSNQPLKPTLKFAGFSFVFLVFVFILFSRFGRLTATLTISLMSETESNKRTSSPWHHIDAGFINRRKCVSVFGRKYAELYEANKHRGNDHMSVLMNDHLLIYLALKWCAVNKIPSLGEVLVDPKENLLFCSTEKVQGCGDTVYSESRKSNNIEFPFDSSYNVLLEYHTSHIYADTQKMLLSKGHKMSIVGEIFKTEKSKIIIHPLIMGSPTYDHPDNRDLPFNYMFDGLRQYEIFAHDVDQFSDCKDINVTNEEWQKAMKSLSENHVNKSFCKLLSDTTTKDWGGEQYDHFTSDLKLNGERKSGAFLFKGPSAYGEMKPNHLGKNGDQIYRLQQSQAEVLFVQHCHHIGEAVRDTLRAFAVKPGNPRHYCLIDGKETYKIFKAYGLLSNQT